LEENEEEGIKSKPSNINMFCWLIWKM